MGMRKWHSYILFSVLLLFAAQNLFAQNHHKKTYKIALVLPFKSTGNHNAVGEAMLDYYQGFAMGAKKLEEEGFKAEISVFDSEKDSFALETLLQSGTLDNTSLIVGPVYPDKLASVEKYCHNKGITLVSPLKYCKPAFQENGLINFFTPDSIRIRAAFEKAIKIFPKHRFYIISDASADSKKDATRIKAAAKQLGFNQIKFVTLNSGKLSSPINRADSFVIFNTIDKISIKPELEKLIKNKKQSWIIAHHDWHGTYRTIVNKNEPQILYPEVTVNTPGDTASVEFEDLYYETYFSDPSKYAYIGYDQAMFLGYSLMAFGDSFVKSTLNMDYRGFINHIHLKKHNQEVVNFGLHFIRLSDGIREEIEP
jgi:ABC-type branched-subunit amino acid transport system substrate-binding protein